MKKLSAFSTSALAAIIESTAHTRNFYLTYYIDNVLKVCREEDLNARSGAGRYQSVPKAS